MPWVLSSLVILISLLVSKKATSPGLTSAVSILAKCKVNGRLSLFLMTFFGPCPLMASSLVWTNLIIGSSSTHLKAFGRMLIWKMLKEAYTPFGTLQLQISWYPIFGSAMLYGNSSKRPAASATPSSGEIPHSNAPLTFLTCTSVFGGGISRSLQKIWLLISLKLKIIAYVNSGSRASTLPLISWANQLSKATMWHMPGIQKAQIKCLLCPTLTLGGQRWSIIP